jgi:hypothetical protein
MGANTRIPWSHHTHNQWIGCADRTKLCVNVIVQSVSRAEAAFTRTLTDLLTAWRSGAPGVALTICATCLREPTTGLDLVMGGTVYVPGRAGRTWPRYLGTTGCQGFLKVARLENGISRVGLHRGDAEVWTPEQVECLGPHAGDGVYSRDFSLYGPRALLFDGWEQVEVRFLDLRAPALWTTP